MLTPRLAAVVLSTMIAGESFPLASMCVSMSWVYADLAFEENAIHLPFGENVCHEFISDRLQFIRRAFPPSKGMMYSLLSGRHQQSVAVLYEHNPLAIGRHLREVVAHTVLRGSRQQRRFAGA